VLRESPPGLRTAKEEGRDKILALFRREAGGTAPDAVLGNRPMGQYAQYFQPDEADVLDACGYNGKISAAAADALRTGNFSRTTTGMISKGIETQWQAATIEAKHRYVQKFMAFMRATGRKAAFFPELEDDERHAGTWTHEPTTRDQENALCEFAVLRVIAGNTPDSAAGIISHIRTWSRVVLVREFGIVGSGSRKSTTSQYLAAMRNFFPPDNSKDKRREPFTWPMVEMINKHAAKVKWMDPGVAVAIAYAGLFRMGELTSTEVRPFHPVLDLAETDVQFLPSFWGANRVVIQLSISKADRQGRKSKLRPRILPVEPGSPGYLLRQLLANRLGITEGRAAVLRANMPLFQARNGKHLARDSVLRFVRTTLAVAGYSKAQQARYGTHSARIGGATRLFQLGATSEILKRMGGWSSDAYKEYIRTQQEDTMVFARRMCSEA
jgi:hypothetical protein